MRRGCIGELSVSAKQMGRSEAVWGLLSLAAENRFPARRSDLAGDSVRMRPLEIWETECLVLARPFGRGIAKARNSNPTWQTTFDGCLD